MHNFILTVPVKSNINELRECMDVDSFGKWFNLLVDSINEFGFPHDGEFNYLGDVVTTSLKYRHGFIIEVNFFCGEELNKKDETVIGIINQYIRNLNGEFRIEYFTCVPTVSSTKTVFKDNQYLVPVGTKHTLDKPLYLFEIDDINWDTLKKEELEWDIQDIGTLIES